MAKYDGLRKLKRNQALHQYHLDNPDASWKEIGEIFGVTSQRAWEINNNEEKRLKAVGSYVGAKATA